jgi:hypothetical protein
MQTNVPNSIVNVLGCRVPVAIIRDSPWSSIPHEREQLRRTQPFAVRGPRGNVFYGSELECAAWITARQTAEATKAHNVALSVKGEV